MRSGGGDVGNDVTRFFRDMFNLPTRSSEVRFVNEASAAEKAPLDPCAFLNKFHDVSSFQKAVEELKGTITWLGQQRGTPGVKLATIERELVHQMTRLIECEAILNSKPTFLSQGETVKKTKLIRGLLNDCRREASRISAQIVKRVTREERSRTLSCGSRLLRPQVKPKPADSPAVKQDATPPHKPES